jgi:hypothetical protein
VTQHVLERTSHVALPLQTAGVKLLQSAPVQAPSKHTWPPQDAPLSCQVPVALQFCGCSPLHCTWPGAQTPWHEEPTPVPTHVWPVQGTGVAQVPVVLHDCCAVVVEHSTWPGAHTPWHEAVPPLTRQVWLEHVWEVPHAPDALQVDTPLFVHSVAPGVHTPWHEATPPLTRHA